MVQDEQILSSSERGLRFLTDIHFSVQKMVQIANVPYKTIVVNMGSGLGKSLFLRVTQEDWPALPDNDFPLWLTWGMVRFGGWYMTTISFGNGPDNHFLGWIHSLQVSLCLVLEEWPKVGNGLGSTIKDKHSLGWNHYLQVTLCLVSEEWPMVGNGQGSTIRDKHSLGKNHSLQVTLCLVSKEWPRVGNGLRS